MLWNSFHSVVTGLLSASNSKTNKAKQWKVNCICISNGFWSNDFTFDIVNLKTNASPAHLVMPPWRAEVRGQADDTVDGICVSGFILHYLWHECSLPLFDPVKVTTTTEPQWPQTHHKHLSIHYCSSYLTCKGLSAAGTCSVVSPCLYGCPITWYQEDSLISPRRKPSTDSSGSERITQVFFVHQSLATSQGSY